MLTQAITLIVDTLLGLFSLALLLRFYLQIFRTPPRNVVSQFLVALTDFIVRPARRIVPGAWGIDLATLLLAWATQLLLMGILYALRGYDFGSNPGAASGMLMLLAAVEIIKLTLYLMLAAVILQALLSWFNPRSPAAPMLNSLTAPFLNVFRRFIPPIGNFDLSPVFALIAIRLLLLIVAMMNQEVARFFWIRLE